MNELLAALNPVQRQAVLHGDGPLLILAGAGSGKTRTLTHRVAHLIGECGVEPWRILAVTFTNKAAGELRERLQRLLGTAEMPWVSTFHSTCVRLLRREIGALGRGTNFIIYDDQDQDRLLRECLRELNVAEQTLTPRAASAYIDAAKNRGVGPEACDRNTRVGRAQRAGVRALPGQTPPRQRASTSAICWSRRCGSSRNTPTSSTATAAASCTCWSTSTRTPTGSSTG